MRQRAREARSAMAVKALIEALKPDGADDELRRSARTACGKASAAVEQLRDALEGLEHVAFGPAPGVGTNEPGAVIASAGIRSLAARLRDSARLRQIAGHRRHPTAVGLPEPSFARSLHGCEPGGPTAFTDICAIERVDRRRAAPMTSTSRSPD
jgi:hypothetical protein